MSKRVSLAVLVLNDSTTDLPCISMMGQYVHASIASAEERTQDPADDADHDRAPECAPEAVHMKSQNDSVHQKQQEPVQNQNKQAQGNENDRRAEDQQERPNKCVENTEQEGGADERGNGVVMDSADNRGGDHHCNRCDSPSKNELFDADHALPQFTLSDDDGEKALANEWMNDNELRAFNH